VIDNNNNINTDNVSEFAVFNYIIKIKFEGLIYELYADDKLITSSENCEDILNRLSDMMKKYEMAKDYYYKNK
jgi:hypothetical protein